MSNNLVVSNRDADTENLPKPAFDWKEFWESCVMWLFGGVLALVPGGLVFIRQPVDKLTFVAFFSNSGIIYTSITMAVIALCANMRRAEITFTAVYMIVIIIGTIIYTLLDDGANIPVLNEGGLYIFNMILLASVLLIGVAMFMYTCYKKGGEV